MNIFSKLVPQNFNDTLALLVMVFVIPGMWIAQGVGVMNLPEGAMGASIALETLIAQFYFRKAKTEADNATNSQG